MTSRRSSLWSEDLPKASVPSGGGGGGGAGAASEAHTEGVSRTGTAQSWSSSSTAPTPSSSPTPEPLSNFIHTPEFKSSTPVPGDMADPPLLLPTTQTDPAESTLPPSTSPTFTVPPSPAQEATSTTSSEDSASFNDTRGLPNLVGHTHDFIASPLSPISTSAAVTKFPSTTAMGMPKGDTSSVKLPTVMFDGYYDPPGRIWRDSIEIANPLPKLKPSTSSSSSSSSSSSTSSSSPGRAATVALAPVAATSSSTLGPQDESSRSQAGGSAEEGEGVYDILSPAPLDQLSKRVLDSVSVSQFLQRKLETGKLSRMSYAPQPPLSSGVAAKRDMLIALSIVAACLFLLAAIVLSSSYDTFLVASYHDYFVTEAVLDLTAFVCVIIVAIMVLARSDAHGFILYLLVFSLALWCVGGGIGLGGRLPLLDDGATIASHVLHLLAIIALFTAILVTIVSVESRKLVTTQRGLPLASLHIDVALREILRLENECEQQRVQLQLDELRMQSLQQPLKHDLNVARAEIDRLLRLNVDLDQRLQDAQNQTGVSQIEARLRDSVRASTSALSRGNHTETFLLENMRNTFDNQLKRSEAAMQILRNDAAALSTRLENERGLRLAAEERAKKAEVHAQHVSEELFRNQEQWRVLEMAANQASSEGEKEGGDGQQQVFRRMWQAKYQALVRDTADYAQTKTDNEHLRREVGLLRDELSAMVKRKDASERLLQEKLAALTNASTSLALASKRWAV